VRLTARPGRAGAPAPPRAGRGRAAAARGRFTTTAAAGTAAVLAGALLLAGCGGPGAPHAAGTATAIPPSGSTGQGHPTHTPRTSPTRAGTGPGSAACLALVSHWPLARRAAQLLVVPADLSDVAGVAPAVAAGAGGVLLTGAPAAPTLAGQLAALRRAARDGLAPLVMADEEGGGVQRLLGAVAPFPWARVVAAEYTTAQTERLGALVGRQMKALGVGMDLAPVLDVDGGPGPDARHPDGLRAYSGDPAVVSAEGLAFARGLRASGVIPVGKHFPGLGHATYDTDFGPAYVPPLAELSRDDLLPFQAAIRAGLPAIMVANAIVPGLTRGPASLSWAAVTGLLRRRLGFTGLILTDSLSAQAVSAAGFSVPQAAVRAVVAGADLVLYGPVGPGEAIALFDDAVGALLAAVRDGSLPVRRLDAAVGQVLAHKRVAPCRPPTA
jgi:beta-N-acetylhexosaminidase